MTIVNAGDSQAQTSTDATTQANRLQLHAVSPHLSSEIMNASRISRMSASEQMELVIGLLPRNSYALENAVERVSNPADSDYRQFLSPEQFGDQFGATTDEYRRVLDWAKAHNLAIVTNQNRLVLKASGHVADIEAALHLHLYYALRADGSRFHTPDVEPSFDIPLPIEHISNLENFDVLKRSVGSGQSGTYHAPDFRNAYASCTDMTGAGQSVGIVTSEDFSQSDVTAYFTSANLASPLLVQKIPNDSSKGATATLEGNLDVQMVLSIAPQAQVVTFVGKDIDSILTDMAAHPEIKQLSSSYFPKGIDSTAKNLLKEFAMQGQSFFQASGDAGALKPSYFSSDNDPRTQPAVTIVGGTNLTMSGTGASYAGETAWSGSSGTVMSFESGGGIPLPSYQAGLATTANQASSIYRNMPDVAAVASNVEIYFDGSPKAIGGTSAAAPLWAGFMALVNQAADQRGLNSFGFVNPTLYSIAASSQYSDAFNDVTTGSTSNSDFSYSSTPGYDLTTGLGSPKCGLIDAMVQPPPICLSRGTECNPNEGPPCCGVGTICVVGSPAKATGICNFPPGCTPLGAVCSTDHSCCSGNCASPLHGTQHHCAVPQ